VQLARVIGEVVATVKDVNLIGTTLLVLQPLSASGEAAGRTLVALDSVGAGVGETVFFVRGREAAFPFYPAEPPTDASIVGIVDHWNTEPDPRFPFPDPRPPTTGSR
jgi:ethanolamine utilization protein EutN